MYLKEHEDWLVAADYYLQLGEDLHWHFQAHGVETDFADEMDFAERDRHFIDAVLLIDKVLNECKGCEYEEERLASEDQKEIDQRRSEDP